MSRRRRFFQRDPESGADAPGADEQAPDEQAPDEGGASESSAESGDAPGAEGAAGEQRGGDTTELLDRALNEIEGCFVRRHLLSELFVVSIGPDD